MNIKITRIEFMGFGAKITDNGLYFAVCMDFLNEGGIRFYDIETKELLETVVFTDEYSFGNVYSVLVSGLSVKRPMYRYFSDNDEFLDPYSTLVYGNEVFGQPVISNNLYSGIAPLKFEEDHGTISTPKIPFSDSILYLAHVRGLTMMDKSVKHKGTFLGLSEKIPYFLELGVTTVVVMPCYEFIECKDQKELEKSDLSWSYKIAAPTDNRVNYWGFDKAFYFAPKSSYSYSDNVSTEFKSLVNDFHKNNLELVMMMYYPENTKTDIILNSLRFYVSKYNVDGFRILGHNIDIYMIAEDPFLKGSKLFFENVDLKSFWSDKPIKYKNLAVYQSMFADRTKSFLKGDEDQVGFYSYAIRENNKTYSTVRYITDYSGFSLHDLYCYERKHNEDNGEDNKDGNNYNYSWNCGMEGPTKKNSVNKLRYRQYQNGLLLSFLCQGTPQLRAGDEWLDSTNGNNNPWCQDNETGWINYKKNATTKNFFDFTKNLIAFRKRHSILHQANELKLYDYLSCKLPDLSFHGEEAYKMNQDPVSREFAVLFAGDYAKQYTRVEEDSIYIVVNMHWEDKIFPLPIREKDRSWFLLFSSDGSTDSDFNEDNASAYENESYIAKGRSVTIFLLRKK